VADGLPRTWSPGDQAERDAVTLMAPIPDLSALLTKFRNVNDVETDHALFQTNVPSVAPQGYLNILFKPSSNQTREAVTQRLRLPPPLIRLFAAWNGARLFFGGLAIYACL